MSKSLKPLDQLHEQSRLRHYSIGPAKAYREGSLLAHYCLLRTSATGTFQPVMMEDYGSTLLWKSDLIFSEGKYASELQIRILRRSFRTQILRSRVSSVFSPFNTWIARPERFFIPDWSVEVLPWLANELPLGHQLTSASTESAGSSRMLLVSGNAITRHRQLLT